MALAFCTFVSVLPSYLLAWLLVYRPRLFAVAAAIGLLGLLAASPMGWHGMEWDTLRWALAAIAFALVLGRALLYARHHPPYWAYGLTALPCALLAGGVMTSGMYPEPTLYSLVYVFAGVPVGIGIAVAAVAAVRALRQRFSGSGR